MLVCPTCDSLRRLAALLPVAMEHWNTSMPEEQQLLGAADAAARSRAASGSSRGGGSGNVADLRRRSMHDDGGYVGPLLGAHCCRLHWASARRALLSVTLGLC